MGGDEDVVIVHRRSDDIFYALGADCPHEGMTTLTAYINQVDGFIIIINFLIIFLTLKCHWLVLAN